MTDVQRSFEPKIVGFFCNWCSYRAADLAGTSRAAYAPNLRIIRVMCSGRIDPTFVLKAFSLGADGVMIAGCHPGECHYLEQNYKTMRRVSMLRHTLAPMGIDEGRVQLVWASAAEGQQLAREINRIVRQVSRLGPLNWPGNWEEHPQRLAALERLAVESPPPPEVRR
jgi:F420-non-reducing hydrogenase iron-sulfur subunit